ncbi:MAG: rane protein [Acidobacteria bacterium]|nr:rane protein [Acidobacteriota bacterium]
MKHSRFANSAALAFAAYAAVTILMTWPLAAGLTHDVPGDFGDPLFTSWVLSWGATHLGRGWWSANIFAPQPLALAYSEHFLPQAIQTLPIYLLTRNPILCYNLLFLSTFAVSGLGMFLLGRELTGSAAAGFVAGLAFAFAPYRIANIPHLQVLSSAWMPFVLFGLHRHFATGRRRPLAFAAAAWLVQNLSCGYYLLFFSPVVLLYIGWELTRRRLWTDRRTLRRVAAAVVVVAAATAPFLLPYLELRRLGFDARSLGEVHRFSADVYAYLTADPNLRVWGLIAQAWPRPEGLLFPGATIALFAVIGAGAARARPRDPRQTDDERLRLSRLAWTAAAILAALVITLLFGYSIRLPRLKITSLPRVLAVCAIGGAILLAVSREARGSVSRWLMSLSGIFSIITLFAIVMSFGPDIHAMGRAVTTTSLYALFYDHVPGFDGIRVPARFAMIATLGLAALTALGVAAIPPPRRRRVSAIAAMLILAEALAVPIPINQNATDYKQAGLAPLPGAIAIGSAVPAVYRYAAQLPASAVLIELPFGEPAFDIRYMFYSTTHWRRLVNGYSGGAPAGYEILTESLKDRGGHPDRAWQGIVDSSATHAVVHEGSYANDAGARVSAWLRSRGAREIAAFGSDRVFVLSAPGPKPPAPGF